MFYNRVFEALNILSLGFRAIEVFYVRVCNDLTWFSKRNLVFYFRVFLHIDARDETLSQTFCFIIGCPAYIKDLKTAHCAASKFCAYFDKVSRLSSAISCRFCGQNRRSDVITFFGCLVTIYGFHQAQTKTVMVRISLTAQDLKIRSFNDDKFNF